MKNKKAILIVFLIIIVIISAFVMYNIIYEKNKNIDTDIDITIDQPKNEEELLESIYIQVKDKNLYNFVSDENIFMNEMIIDSKETEDGYEIYVKPIFIREVTTEDESFYELYSDYNSETNILENKLIDVDKQDYDIAVKDNSVDNVSNINLISLINQDDLHTYKYIFKYDENTKTYTFKQFIEI